jgi:putative endopeptidase
VNGRWARKEVIPDQYVYSGNVLALRLQAERAVKGIVEELAAVPHPQGSVEQRMADSYKAFLDQRAIDAAGMARPSRGCRASGRRRHAPTCRH